MREIFRKHLYISGRVQGVGYRAYFMKHARKLGLKGWVKNRVDGRVEAVIDGDKDQLKMMVEYARKGPGWARVEQVVEQNEEFQGEYNDFRIKH